VPKSTPSSRYQRTVMDWAQYEAVLYAKARRDGMDHAAAEKFARARVTEQNNLRNQELEKAKLQAILRSNRKR